ncbi:slipin family protein, partial [Streptomyces sp. NPDC003483]
ELQASKKLAEAAGVMSEQPAALQLRLLQTVVAVAAEKNSTLVLPFPVELLRFLERAQQPASAAPTTEPVAPTAEPVASTAASAVPTVEPVVPAPSASASVPPVSASPASASGPEPSAPEASAPEASA